MRSQGMARVVGWGQKVRPRPVSASAGALEQTMKGVSLLLR
jgi:hypothetical protein